MNKSKLIAVIGMFTATPVVYKLSSSPDQFLASGLVVVVVVAAVNAFHFMGKRGSL